MKLPTFQECRLAQKESRATALQIFISENEPADEMISELFRSELSAVIEEHCKLDKKVIEDAFDMAYNYHRGLEVEFKGTELEETRTYEEMKNDFFVKHVFIKPEKTEA